MGIDVESAGRSRAEEQEQERERSAGMQCNGAVDGVVYWWIGLVVGFCGRVASM